MKETHRYDDIIHLSRPVSKKRSPMSNFDRAAQFSPFAALTGYEETIEETGRLTDSAVELWEDARIELDRRQQFLLENAGRNPEVTVRYFSPDSRKEGGAYLTAKGFLKSVDPIHRILQLQDGTRIPLDNITELNSPLFDV
jgi:hypothetical protein